MNAWNEGGVTRIGPTKTWEVWITQLKLYLVCTFYDKQIKAKKYKRKFGPEQIFLGGDCSMKSGLKTFIETSYFFS